MLARCKHPGGHNTSTTYVHAMAYIHCAVNMALCSTPNSGLTGSPDESGASRREKGLSRSGNERVRRILIQLSWRMQRFQLDGGLVRWFKTRTANSRRSRKPMIVALARKLVIALWRYVNTGMVPEGFKLANSSIVQSSNKRNRRSSVWHARPLSSDLPRTLRGSGCSRRPTASIPECRMDTAASEPRCRCV